MEPAEGNTQEAPLGLSNAVEALLQPSTEADPKKRAPKPEEVTESEGSVKPEEAAVKQSQRPTVELDEQPEADEDEAEPDEDEAEDDDVEDSEGEGEDEDDGESEPETVFELEDGSKVDLDELKRGYLRQADYTRKTQEVAQARKQVEEAYKSRVQERQTLAENLSLALNVVEPQLAELAKTDWDSLATQDPYAYAEKRALFDQASTRYQKLTAQAQQLVQQQQAEQQRQMQAKLKHEGEKLKMAIPDFADPQKGRALRAAITEYALSQGLSESEAKAITDHRVIVMLDKARRYDALQRGELTAARKKVSKSPKKAMAPGKPKSKSQRQQQTRQQQLSKLKSSGSLDDAVSLLLTG